MYDYRLFFPNIAFDDRDRKPRRPFPGHEAEKRVYRLIGERRVARDAGRR